MVEIEKGQIKEIIDILKRLDVRGFESNDLLIGIVRFLMAKLNGGNENGSN